MFCNIPRKIKEEEKTAIFDENTLPWDQMVS
jgi:hypothetical protein